MVRTVVALVCLGAGSVGSTAADAQDKVRPAAITALSACRALTDSTARLACYDQQAAALDEAEKRGDVLIADRAEVRKTKRSLFGLNLPDFSLFKKRDDQPDEPEIQEVETTLSGASYGNRAWTFVLADGSRWRQIDPLTIYEPRAGEKVVIKRAAMGSFLLKVGNQRAVRAQRIN